jgi:hypothetical protein
MSVEKSDLNRYATTRVIAGMIQQLFTSAKTITLRTGRTSTMTVTFQLVGTY